MHRTNCLPAPFAPLPPLAAPAPDFPDSEPSMDDTSDVVAATAKKEALYMLRVTFLLNFATGW